MDIAVLESRLSDEEMRSLGLVPLPIGSAGSRSPLKGALFVGCGFSKDAETYPRGINFEGYFTEFQCLQNKADTPDDCKSIAAMGKPWNIPFEGQQQVDLYEFRDDGSRLERGFSGSPICVEIDPTSGSKMCVGMLSTRRLAANVSSTHGFVIPYEQIKVACVRALPFHPYADCIIVVLAAKKAEFDELCSRLELDGLRQRSPHYHPDARDGWRPFTLEDPTVETMISGAPADSPSWQLSSEYIDRSDPTFVDYLAERDEGALVYVIDPSSLDLDAPALREFIRLATDYNRGACYVFPLCGAMNDLSRSAIEHKLKERLGFRLWNRHNGERIKLTRDCTDFSDRLHSLANQAYERFVRETRGHPRRRGEPAATGATPARMQWERQHPSS